MKKIELKPCPSCENDLVELITGNKKFDHVVCKNCGVQGPYFDGHPEDAINEWNSMPRRVIADSNRPNWDRYYMDMTFYIAQKSLDPSTKHGCIVVDEEHTPLSMGFNSPPRLCIDEDIPSTRPEKYSFYIHAEENSIINAARTGVSLKGATFYITGYPCSRCFRMMANVGAKKIIYGPISSKCVQEEDLKAIKIMNRVKGVVTNYTTRIEMVSMPDLPGSVLAKAQEYITEKCSHLV